MAKAKHPRRAPITKRARPAPALFVYGSLMARRNWRHLVGAAAARSLEIVPVRLRGWRRCWNGGGHYYAGAVLNLARDPRAAMWGGLVEGLSEEIWTKIDENEKSHLPRVRLLVTTARGRRVWAYGYRQRSSRPEGWPAASYLAGVRAGARELGRGVERDVEEDVARLRGLLRARRPAGRG